MESRVVKIYRCKRCSAPIKQHDLLQSHLHWHGIKDPKIDLYFEEIDDVSTVTDTAASASSRRQSAPPWVLIVSLALLAVMGVVYVMTS
jgi:hypothetical protein